MSIAMVFHFQWLPMGQAPGIHNHLIACRLWYGLWDNSWSFSNSEIACKATSQDNFKFLKGPKEDLEISAGHYQEALA
jgi:hypothetical protein